MASSPAAADDIACPFVVTGLPPPATLPSGWWTTQGGTNSFLTFAAAAGPSHTDIVEVVGVHVLRCRYGEYGALFRQAPPGSVCDAVDKGFACEAAK